MEPVTQTKIPMSAKSLRFLFAYFKILILIGLIGLLCFIMDRIELKIVNLRLSIFNTSIIVSLFSALLGSAIHYIRKLYKACINCRFIEPNSESDNQHQLGIFNYYLLRPLFSLSFSVLFILACRAGFSFLVKYTEPKTEFIFFSAFIAFFIGYSSGDVIDKLEIHGKKIIDKYSERL